MRTHTEGFKTNIKQFGREIDIKITYQQNGQTIELGVEELNSVVMSFEGSILKSIMKEATIDAPNEIPKDTLLNIIFGIKVNNTYEYLNMGNYVVKEVEKQEDTNSYRMKCYDKILYSMKQYEGINIEYPTTVRTYINALCSKIGLTFKNSEDEFANYDKEISSDLYLDQNLTYRNVLDELAQVTGSLICLDNNDELEIRYPSETNDLINERYLKDVNVEFGKKFGPVNSIVLSRAAESDNVYIRDEESITENGLCEIKIKENQIMNFNNRDEFLPDLLEVLDGLEFYINDYTSTGICYLEIGDFYKVQVGEQLYKCLMLNDTIEVERGLVETIYTDEPKESQTDYTKADTTDNKINQTWIIANKQEGYIEALTTRVTTVEDNVSNSYTKQQIDDFFIDAENGVVNKFETYGGNNIFRNTGLWNEDKKEKVYLYPSNDLYPSNELYLLAQPYYEYWEGRVKREKEDKAANSNALLLQNDTLLQEQQVRNGDYVVSFKYEKINENANVVAIINGEEINLENTEGEIIKNLNVTLQNIKVIFISNMDDSCKIYDLMVNAGKEKAEYSQNQNETTTDTVKIGKGITIESSETNTTFKADSDGVRVYNSRYLKSEPIAYFTDVGFESKKAIIEDDAEISSVLFKKVGYNTWITRL